MYEYKTNDLRPKNGYEIAEYISDTANLAQKFHIDIITNAVNSAKESGKLTDVVEFWKWLRSNYSESGIFDSANNMQEYINQGAGKLEWLNKQIQGKGYEWDWIQSQRANFKNLFNRFDAGTIANKPAVDVTKTNLLTGEMTEYQMKAYVSKANPHLHNTPKDITVVTNAEKVDIVKGNGYNNVESFQNADIINKNVSRRMAQIKNGKAAPCYTLRNVGLTMAKAGIVGAVVSASIEGFARWKDYKSGSITKEEYLIEIAKSAGEGGAISAATSGIMIPISSVLTTVGFAGAPITIPVSIVVGIGLSKIIAPMFGRGDYKKILGEAQFYQELINMHDDLVEELIQAKQDFEIFIMEYLNQLQQYQELSIIADNLRVLHHKSNERIYLNNMELDMLLDDLEQYVDKKYGEWI